LRSLRSISVLFAALATCSLAHATDIIQTYDFSNVNLLMNKGATKDYGTISGSVTIDLTTGTTVSGDFTVLSGATTLGGTNYNETDVFTTILTQDKAGKTDGYIDTVFSPSPGSFDFDLEYVISGDTVTLCQTGGACDFNNKPTEQSHLDSTPGNLDLTTGSFVAAATPEPSSLILLGTGLLGAAGGILRRRRSA
jgi:PEP-CTERM motif